MPIRNDQIEQSINFYWDFVLPDGTVLPYLLKFQHTDVGPILTISQEGLEPIELPAEMFPDVTNFLAQQGAMRGGVPTINRPQGVPLPSISKKTGNLSLQTKGVVARTAQISQAAAAVNLTQDAPQEDSMVIKVDPEEIEKLKQERLAAKAKANTAKAHLRSNHGPAQS